MRWWLTHSCGAAGITLGDVMLENGCSLLAAILVNIVFIMISLLAYTAPERKEQDND